MPGCGFALENAPLYCVRMLSELLSSWELLLQQRTGTHWAVNSAAHSLTGNGAGMRDRSGALCGERSW